jgi:heterodisulfide reductase subunit B
MSSTAKEYDLSLRAVCDRLDVALDEIEDWSCCGASSGHSTDRLLSLALPARTLAAVQDTDVAVACPACYVRLKGAGQEVGKDAQLRHEVERMVGSPLGADHKVSHLLDVICNDVGFDEVEKQVERPLSGLKLVAYYGCYLVRPQEVTGFDDPENPQTMDTLFRALGAEAGGLSLVKRDVVTRLVGGLVESAQEVGAEAIVTACPLCQSNLDSAQKTLPIVYFTELMGLAMGVPDVRPWFRRHLVSPLPTLARYNLI